MENTKRHFIESTEETRLPMSWYFTDEIYQQERDKFFLNAYYVGHASMVPRVGDYYVLPWHNNAKVLVRNANSVNLLSNICRHRQAKLLNDCGNIKEITCPIHHWKYHLDGSLHVPRLGPCQQFHLEPEPLQAWNQLLFNGKPQLEQELNTLDLKQYIDLDNYSFSNRVITPYNFNWKIFVEIYLDNYHVNIFHPGLGHFIDTNNLIMQHSNPNYFVQVFGQKAHLTHPGSESFKRWQDLLLQSAFSPTYTFGAIWIMYYPNVMIEIYPHVMVVSTVWPTSPSQCMNVIEYYYPDSLLKSEKELIAAQQRAYDETALEDEEICNRIYQGRHMLYTQKKEEYGPYLSPLEEGIPLFNAFIKKNIVSI